MDINDGFGGGESLSSAESHAIIDLPAPDQNGEGASLSTNDSQLGFDRPDPVIIGQIAMHYRLAKAAEQSRIIIDQRLVSFVRVYLTAWNPGDDDEARKKHKAQAVRVVSALQKAAQKLEPGQTIYDAIKAHKDDVDLYPLAADMVLNAQPSREAFDAMAAQHQKSATKLAEKLPAWERIQHVRGFSAWGLAVLVGEAGDIGAYSGCRKLYKRLGWAPKESYPEVSGARVVPRRTKGRVYGIIQDPLFKQQWRGEAGPNGEKIPDAQKGRPENIPAHAIGPYGTVYGESKARHLEAGKMNGHAEKLARRTMLKALIHDVHCAWFGKPLLFAVSRFSDSCPGSGQNVSEDLP